MLPRVELTFDRAAFGVLRVKFYMTAVESYLHIDEYLKLFV